MKVQTNICRNAVTLDGIWKFKTVGDDFSAAEPLKDYKLMLVPASMNDVVTDADLRDYVGAVAYETEFSCPIERGREYRLRIGATSHKCKIYLNGEFVGSSDTAFLPIDLKFSDLKELNRLTVIIDNRLDYNTLPPGRLVKGNELYVCDRLDKYAIEGDENLFPKEKQIINHDFYNYTGIHRSVFVYSSNEKHIDDITIKTVVQGDYRRVSVKIDGDDKRLYVNDKPVYLKGFGMHEDFPVIGKGNNSAVNIRDFELLEWINANCFRTSHYPYSEEIMDLADEYGLLVIDEVPAVGCNN